MTMPRRAWRRRAATLSAILVLFIGAHCFAETRTVPAHGIAVNIPEGWQDAPEIAASVRAPAELIVAAVNADKSKSFTAIAVKVAKNGSFSHEEFIRGMQQPMKDRGWKVSANAPLVIDGITFNSFSANESTREAPLVQTASTLANGHAYTLSISSRTANPVEDAELQSIVHSFRFLTRPSLIAAKGTAFRLGYIFGLVTFALAGLALLYALIAWLSRSKTRRP